RQIIKRTDNYLMVSGTKKNPPERSRIRAIIEVLIGGIWIFFFKSIIPHFVKS
ncbi:MAG: hypothetical protein ACI90V_002507, partial [Bacillariaceae sp.]